MVKSVGKVVAEDTLDAVQRQVQIFGDLSGRPAGGGKAYVCYRRQAPFAAQGVKIAKKAYPCVGPLVHEHVSFFR